MFCMVRAFVSVSRQKGSLSSAESQGAHENYYLFAYNTVVVLLQDTPRHKGPHLGKT